MLTIWVSLDVAMFDAEIINSENLYGSAVDASSSGKRVEIPRSYAIAKRAMDLLAVVILLPVTLIAAACLLVLNPFFNKGALLYRQTRMGQGCKPFTAYKFRSMKEASLVKRGAFDALEEDRITKLGSLMRKLRVDELPQIINILKGDMSLVGPRPDFFDHAKVYMIEIPGYCERYAVRPGVTGLAQTEIGYVSDEFGFQRKVAADLSYISKMSLSFDLKVIFRTALIVVARHGR